jgi:energy-coupling factor transporter transmembrane protein EcfT
VAELSVFAYHPGRGGLHGFDGRFKLLTLLMLTMAIAAGRPAGLLITSTLLLGGISACGVPLGALLREARYFGAFLLLIWLVRALGTSGRALITVGPLQLTAEGAGQGGLVCWRMAMVLAAGLIFTRTTRMAEVRAATAWLLRPVPFLDGRQAATMLGLLVRFIPLILTQAQETRRAQQARGIDARHNPITRLTTAALPLLRATFLKADRIAVAMTARGYTGTTTPFPFTSGPRDWALLGFTTALALSQLLY